MDKIKHILHLIKEFIPPIHPAGNIFIFIAAVATFILGFMVNAFGWIGLIITCWVAYFFRDPQRAVPVGDNLVVSPADGTVSLIDNSVLAPAELGTNGALYNRISIFLNIFDVHVNRIPVGGTISNLNYRPGKFLSADLDKASEANERQSIIIDTATGQQVICVQIAGMIARRIICNLTSEQQVVGGQRYGIIRFGSRLDVYLPENIKPQVAIGQKVIGGETILADLAGDLPQKIAVIL